MYCTGCGAKLPDTAAFCNECGTKAEDEILEAFEEKGDGGLADRIGVQGLTVTQEVEYNDLGWGKGFFNYRVEKTENLLLGPFAKPLLICLGITVVVGIIGMISAGWVLGLLLVAVAVKIIDGIYIERFQDSHSAIRFMQPEGLTANKVMAAVLGLGASVQEKEAGEIHITYEDQSYVLRFYDSNTFGITPMGAVKSKGAGRWLVPNAKTFLMAAMHVAAIAIAIQKIN